MHALAIALLIFCLRILDVSIGTVRVIYTVRGKRTMSFILGVLESGIWIFAIARCMSYINRGDPWAIVGWSLGFGAGTAVGITIERWLGQGSVLFRIITRAGEPNMPLRNELASRDVGVTALMGEGRDGEIKLLFVVAPRKRAKEILGVVQKLDPHAFITIDPVSEAIGGYVPVAAEANAVRK
jgi:uncharacterized protein YebE (UPF0316 family)